MFKILKNQQTLKHDKHVCYFFILCILHLLLYKKYIFMQFQIILYIYVYKVIQNKVAKLKDERVHKKECGTTSVICKLYVMKKTKQRQNREHSASFYLSCFCIYILFHFYDHYYEGDSIIIARFVYSVFLHCGD